MSERRGSVLLTGGSGTVGKAVLRHLLRDGREVAALARSDEASRMLEEAGAKPCRGDVLDRDSLAAAMSARQTVFHVAGVNAFCLRDTSQMYRVNVIGSRNVIAAAHEAGVERVVYTSSAATVGEEKGTVGREDSEHRGWFMSHYERSKFLAERAVLEDSARLGIETVCVNPSSTQGPGRAGGTGRVLVYFLQGKLRFYVDTRVSLIDIDDCAAGHVLAERNGAPGERYILNSATLALHEALALVTRLTSVSHTARSLPSFVARSGGAVAEAMGRVRGKTPSVCREMIRTLLHGHNYDGSRASRELGIQYTSVEKTMARTIRWLVDEGHVPASVLPAGGG